VTDRPRRLTFYFDYISHNAYVAFTQLPELADRHGVEVDLVPVLFAGLLNAHGQLGPAEVPAKARWMGRDVIRKAKRLGIPLRAPASHPFNPLLSLRASSLTLRAEERHALVSSLFNATWTESLDVSDPAVVSEAALRAGLDGASVVEQATGDAAKRALREQTDRAVEAGVFGIPSMLVDSVVFWGYDDFPNLDLYLRGEETVTDADFLAWSKLEPSSVRRR
jgi:2-hydroxychromene-2-carboxylate isomerase